MEEYVVKKYGGQELFQTEWGTEWVGPGKGTRFKTLGRAEAEAAKHPGSKALYAESKRFCVLSDKGELRVEGRSSRWVPFGLGSRLTKKHAVTLAEAVGGKKKGVGAYVATSEDLKRTLIEAMEAPNAGRRHGSFDSMPKAEEHTTVLDVKQRYPEAFANPPPYLPDFPDDTPVELEASTGAMVVPFDDTWVYFPGEGWDCYGWDPPKS